MKHKLNTLGIILISVVGMMLLFALFVGTGNYFQSVDKIVPGNIFIILFPIVTYLTVTFFNRRVNQLNSSNYGFHFKYFWKNVLIGISLAVLITSVVLIVVKLFWGIPFEFIAFKPDFETPLLRLIVATISIGAWEEFYFRGLVYNTLLKNKFGFHLSALISAIVFSILHFSSIDMSESSWAWYIGIIFLGYILVIIYTVTNSIWSVVSFHFIWNFLARLLDNKRNEIGLFEIPNYIEYSKTLDNIMVIALGIFLMVFLLITTKKSVFEKIDSYKTTITNAKHN